MEQNDKQQEEQQEKNEWLVKIENWIDSKATVIDWVLIILAVFGFIIWRLVIYAVKTRNMQIRLTLYGIAAYIGIQILVNLGGVVGVVPITGVTFPLISYGGSSLMSWGITFGIAFNMIGVLKKNESLRERE